MTYQRLKEYGDKKPGDCETWQKESLLKYYRVFYVNAYATHLECGGHNKAFWNETALKKWGEKIKEFGGEIPSRDEVSKFGIFNGAGSY